MGTCPRPNCKIVHTRTDAGSAARLKLVLEPIFEAQLPSSYGFRPRRTGSSSTRPFPKAVPADLDVHLICDTFVTNKPPRPTNGSQNIAAPGRRKHVSTGQGIAEVVSGYDFGDAA